MCVYLEVGKTLSFLAAGFIPCWENVYGLTSMVAKSMSELVFLER
jgi:hypothetical protein